MMFLVAFLLSYAGFLLLCLSMGRHHRELKARPFAAPVPLVLRLCGYCLLAIALWPCTVMLGSSVGIVLWLGTLSAAALLLVILLAWSPRLALGGTAARAIAALIERLCGSTR